MCYGGRPKAVPANFYSCCEKSRAGVGYTGLISNGDINSCQLRNRNSRLRLFAERRRYWKGIYDYLIGFGYRIEFRW